MPYFSGKIYLTDVFFLFGAVKNEKTSKCPIFGWIQA